MKKLANLGLALALMLVAFCKKPTTQVGPDGQPIPVAGQTKTKATITAAAGGYVVLANMRLTIPQGALEQDTEITAEMAQPNYTALDGAEPVGASVSFKPDGLQFLKPASLELCYTAQEIAEKNLLEKSAMVYLAGGDNELTAISGRVNQATHCVSSSIEHFSSYIAAAQGQVPGNTAPSVGGANFLPATPMAGIPARVRTTLSDMNGGTTQGVIVTAFLNYRVIGAPTYTRVALQPDTTDPSVSNRYFATIPQAAATLAGIEYFFEATDNLNVKQTTTAQTQNINKTAGVLRLTPAASLNISAGFVREFTVQADDNGTGGWQDIPADNVTVAGGIGNISQTGPSTVKFAATTSGTGSINLVSGSLNASTPVTVQAGLLDHIEIMNSSQVIITTTISMPTNGTFQFDALGYDSYGNTAVINPTFTVNGGIGSINGTALFTAGSSVASGSLTADVGGLTDSVNINIIDSTPPVPGADLSFISITNSSLTISWGSASDNVTAAANLEYKVVKDNTAASNINTIALADAKTGGDLLQDWATSITSKATSGLAASTTYYFAVLVRDSAGNKALYAPAGELTAVAPPSGLSYSGNPFSFIVNTGVGTITPSVLGTVTGCSTNPNLPPGLSIAATNCSISGTPTQPQTTASYLITASNVSGNATANISISVIALQQMGGSRQGNPLSLTTGVSIAAGLAGSQAFLDGTGNAARFNLTAGVTTDGSNLYIADAGNQVIRKLVISTGDVSTLAGSPGNSGSADGTGTSARFSQPYGITTDGTSLYVCDMNNHTIRKILVVSGATSTFAGSAGVIGSADGTGSAARFNYPRHITTDGISLYVADGANRTIRKIIIATGDVSTIAGLAGTAGSTDGIGSAARFQIPQGITTDGTNLYVTDVSAFTVRQIVLSSGSVSTLAGSAFLSGSADGAGSLARFSSPEGITSDGSHLYIADLGNHTVRKIVMSTGNTTTLAGLAGASGAADGTGSTARFNFPLGITTNGSALFISDRNNFIIRRLD